MLTSMTGAPQAGSTQTRTSPRPTCVVCGSDLDLHERAKGEVCCRLKCQTVLAVRARESERAARAADRAAALAWFVEAGATITEPARVGAVPALDRELVPADPARVESFRAALRNSAEALHSEPPGETDPDVDIETEQGPFIIAACTNCRGRCCLRGGTHAFLTTSELRRQIARQPDLSPDDLIERYMAKIPAVSVEGSCVFHGEKGCVLPREERAAICNWYRCKTLAEWVDIVAPEPEKPAFVAALDGGAVFRGSVVPGQSTG